MIFDQAKLDFLRADVARRAYKHKLHGTAAWKFFLAEIQYRSLFWYRLTEASKIRSFTYLFHRIYLRSSRKFGLEINVSHLGGGVIMPHWGRIFLNAESIGDNLYVFHNVTIGNDYKTGRPKIGNDVFVGVGSSILGNITIGDHVIVAAGSVLFKDVPACSLVAGNPASVIRKIQEEEIEEMIGY